MTTAQLDSLVTLLRSRPASETPDVGEVRAGFEKMGAFLGGAPDAKCEKVDAGGVPAEWVAAPPSVAAGWEAVSEAAASAPRRLERLAQQRFAAAPWRLMRSHPVVSRAVISTAAASIMDSTMVADLG